MSPEKAQCLIEPVPAVSTVFAVCYSFSLISVFSVTAPRLLFLSLCYLPINQQENRPCKTYLSNSKALILTA